MTDMWAPHPHFEGYVSRSVLYKADSAGIISDVDGRDIGDLKLQGCDVIRPAESVEATESGNRAAAFAESFYQQPVHEESPRAHRAPRARRSHAEHEHEVPEVNPDDSE